MNWKLTRTDTNVLEVRMHYTIDSEFYFLLQSDIHFDNPKCDRKMYFKHLEEAKSRKAGVLTFGDFFCLMQGRHDRRSSKSDIRPEHNKKNYQDEVILDSAGHLVDYKDHFIAFSDGNHETAVLKNVETNPLARLVDRLNLEHKANAFHMPYAGFIKFVFTKADGTRVRKVMLAYHHGKWGGVVSKGTQSVPRFASILPQADVVVCGHTHDKWYVQHPMYHIKSNGKQTFRTQHHVKTATYKQEFGTGSGFAVEKIVTPKPLGGWFMKIKPGPQDLELSFEEVS